MNNNILNGPYLLDPTTSQITIAWEMERESSVSLSYSADKAAGQTVVPEFDHELPCKEYINGCYLYTAILTGLQAGTKYEYSIFENGEVLVKADFMTLAEQPEKIKMVTISDSHLFHTEKQFAAMIKAVKPEMILHGGDISFGTGYQHGQYVDNWFNKIPEVLAHTPAYYIPGNHDDGPFYESFFAKPQAKTVNTADGGFAFSFDYGTTHFTMSDSNSWGLFEMNAVNSGLEADDATKRRIQETLQWIENDLNSEAARKADWRVLIVHHPYTDLFNNRYIVPIAERCNVDLVIGGHLHYYIKTISINPEIGARMAYICQGSTQEPEASLDLPTGGKRLLGDFPEVTAMGRSNYGVLEITPKEIFYRMYGFTEEAGKDELVDTVHLTHDEPQVEIGDVELRRLDNVGRVEVRALAKNVGKNPASVNMTLFDNQTEHTINLFGQEENSHVIFLEAGEEAKVTTIYQAATQGDHEICVDGETLKIVVFEPEQLSYAHMKIFPGTGDQSDCLQASIEATNNLDREIFVAIPLYINQRIAETKNMFFRGHEKKFIEFHFKFQKGGSYQVSIADQLPKEIEIEGGIRIVPRIHDKSGHGHYGLLHGTPKVIPQDGHVEVCFEKYGDYIEIPPNPDLCVANGFTSMVWAKVDRLAKPNEMGHNPLMVRGKSVGWGATYLMRMVIERAGGLKWGVCHDITEYSWQGGHADIGSWMQYTMAFDKQHGGDSWCNGENVAHVSGIESSCQLRQWDTEPIFIGYSYIGHVIPEIGRPKYFTHLPGHVSQARFYKTGLTEEENQSICDAPTEKGPSCNKLAVWFDFHDILTVGTHTTEWRHPAVYDPDFVTEKKYWHFKQLRVQTELPIQAGLKATVEVSDDAATVKGHMTIILKNGTSYIDLSALPEAQYIRIVTEFSAEVGAEGTFVPVLKEYQITALNKTDFTEIYWSTRKDFERGTFTGAVGFAPVNRLREFPEYTDVIHG